MLGEVLVWDFGIWGGTGVEWMKDGCSGEGLVVGGSIGEERSGVGGDKVRRWSGTMIHTIHG